MRKVLVVLLFAAIACSTSGPTRVQVIGSAEDLASIAGEWVGTYEDRNAGTSGSITFYLADDPKGARGDVILVPPRDVIYRGVEHQPQTSYSGALVLSIEFVQVASEEISGKIAAYTDPQSPFGTLETHFAGHRDGEWIEGTFVTYSSEGVSPRRGTWRVHRKPRS